MLPARAGPRRPDSARRRRADRAPSGLTGRRSLAERFYIGEYAGVTRMLFDCFEYFAPGWVPAGLPGAMELKPARAFKRR